MNVAGWNPPLERVVSPVVAAGFLGVSPDVLRRIARAGLVKVERRPHTQGTEAVYAPLEEWMKGLRAWRNRYRPGLLGRREAAKALGITVQTAKNLIGRGYLQGERVPMGEKRYRVMATLEEWREAYERYRRDHPMMRGMERRRRKPVQAKALRAVVGEEVLRRRLTELREREVEFRAFVLAVKRGWPLGDGFFARRSALNTLSEVV